LALSLSHLAIKNLLARSLLSTWSFWGHISLHLVPWLGVGFPTNPGGTLILTHPMTTLGTWLARTHPPDCPHSHPTPDILWWVHLPFLGSLYGLSLWCVWVLEHFPCFGLSLSGSDGRGIPFSTGFGFYRVRDPTKPRPR
jgi:hypothetical protein